MPATLSFGADERNYAVALDSDANGLVDHARCVVRRSDGSSKVLRRDGGERRTIGSFDATTGLTRVRCAWAGTAPTGNVRVFVAQESNTLRTVAVLVIALGTLVLGAALWPLVRGRLSGA